MKKLFAVKHVPTNKLVGEYYAEKRTAKQERDRLNVEAGKAVHVVTAGPDHRRFKK